MDSYLTRTISLLGEDNIKTLENKVILIVGLGGVGATALISLARSGFKNFILMDFDKVDVTNLNRQILYYSTDVNRYKVDVCAERIADISRDINVVKINEFLSNENINTLDNYHIDFIVDAIDKIPSKICLYSYCLKKDIPLISSLGMGKRINPELVKITTLNKTEGDPLAKKLRLECKRNNIDLTKIDVIFSTEPPICKGQEIASMIMVPSTAGLLITKFIISYLLNM